MPLIIIMLMAYMLLPIVGEIAIYSGMYDIPAGDVDLSLILNNSFFVIIVILTCIFISNLTKAKQTTTPQNIKRTIIRINILLFIFMLFVFTAAGYKIYLLGMTTGQVRTSFGWYGFIYTWIAKYLTPTLLLFSALLYLNAEKEKKLQLFPLYILSWILTLLIAVFTGYKSNIVTLLLPAISILIFNKKFPIKLFIIIPLFLVLIIFMTTLIKGYSFNTAYYFILHRMTVMTAFGTVGVWNYYPDGASLNESILLSYGLFGTNIASVLSGYDVNSIQFLGTNLSKLITYKAYPDSYSALTGEVNVTVTNFGEAWYMLNVLYPIYAIIAGAISGFTIFKLKKSLTNGNYCWAACIMTYFYIVILPWFNSGNIFHLVSAPSLFWLVGTFFLLKVIYQGRF